MARKIKFPLEMKDGTMVRTLEELKENFDFEKLVTYFLNGKLYTWLNDRGYSEEADKLNNLNKGDNFEQNLCGIFGVKYERNESINLEEIEVNNEKIKRIKEITDDLEIIKEADKVAVNNEEFIRLLNSDTSTIYLLDNEFKFPLNIKNKKIIGLNNAKVIIESAEFINFDNNQVFFENVRFNEEYNKLVQEENLHKRKSQWYKIPKPTDSLLSKKQREICEKYFNIIQDSLIDFEFDINLYGKSFNNIVNEITNKLGGFWLLNRCINPLEIIFDKEECNPYSRTIIELSETYNSAIDKEIDTIDELVMETVRAITIGSFKNNYIRSVFNKGIDGINEVIKESEKSDNEKLKYVVIFWCLFVIAVDEHMYYEKVGIIADLSYMLKIEEEEMKKMVSIVKYVLNDIKNLKNVNFTTQSGEVVL